MIRLVNDHINEVLIEHRNIIGKYFSTRLQKESTIQMKPFKSTHELLKKYHLFQLDDIFEKRFKPFSEIDLGAIEVEQLYKKLVIQKKIRKNKRSTKEKHKEINKYFTSIEKVVYFCDEYKTCLNPYIENDNCDFLIFNNLFIDSLMKAMLSDGLIAKKKYKDVKEKRRVITAFILDEKQFNERYTKIMEEFYKNISFETFEKEILDWLYHHDIKDIKSLNDYIGMTANKLIECIHKFYTIQTEKNIKNTYYNLNKEYKLISYPRSIDEFPIVYELFSNEDRGIKINKTKVYSAQLFIKKFDLRICPYCNRNYIHNIKIDEKEERKIAQIDHIFPKSIFPYFAISAYNLVPICPSCNFHKNNKVIFYSPYSDFSMEEQLFRFSYRGEFTGRFNRENPNIQIDITSSDSSMKELIDVLELKSMYNMHIEEVFDIFLLRTLYTDSRIEEIISLMKKSNIPISKSELYEMIFGINIIKPLYSKYPLSKLRYDTYKFLGSSAYDLEEQ